MTDQSWAEEHGECGIRNKAVFIISLSLFALAVTLRINNLATVSERSPDEYIYTNQAKAVVQHGFKGMRMLVDRYNADGRLWIYPPPTRVGYIFALSTAMKLTGRQDEKAGSYLSCFLSIISLALLGVVGMRFFNPWITLPAMLFMSLSPIELAMARRAWQDSMVECVSLFLVYLCCEITVKPRRIWVYLLVLLVGGFIILVKESGALVYFLCAVWILYILIVKEKSPGLAVILLSASAASVAASVAVLVNLAGGISAVKEVLTHVVQEMPRNSYAIEFQSGPWYNLLTGFWILSPFCALMFIPGVCGSFFRFDEHTQKISFGLSGNSQQAIAIIFFVLSFSTAAIAMPHYQNLRYTSAIYGPLYLVSGMGFCRIVLFFRKAAPRLRHLATFFLITAMLVGALSGYRTFKDIFVDKGALDLSVGLIKKLN